MLIMVTEPLHTTIDKDLKKIALINDVLFSEALEIGVNVILKRNEGVNALINRKKEIKIEVEKLKSEYEIINKEVNKLKELEAEKKELEKKELEKKENCCEMCGDNIMGKKYKFKGRQLCKSCWIADRLII